MWCLKGGGGDGEQMMHVHNVGCTSGIRTLLDTLFPRRRVPVQFCVDPAAGGADAGAGGAGEAVRAVRPRDRHHHHAGD